MRFGGIPMTAIVKRRDVPVTAEILVSPGDKVLPEQPVARIETLPGRLSRIDVAGALSVHKGDAPGCLVKERGERVSEGDVLAVGGTFFSRSALRSPASGVLSIVSKTTGVAYVREDLELGSQEGPTEVDVAKRLGVAPWVMTTYFSDDIYVGKNVTKGQVLAARSGVGVKGVLVRAPVYGRITEISKAKGAITISPLFKSQSITAFVKGVVGEVVPGEMVEVKGHGHLVNGVWGMGDEGIGKLHFVDGDLTEERSIPEGSVVLVKGTATQKSLERAAQQGVSGVILRYLGSLDAMGFAEGIKNMGITGDENVPFPVILLEGFRPATVPHESFEFLSGCQGLDCSVRGATHIRAGVIRPEILVFADDEGGDF